MKYPRVGIGVIIKNREGKVLVGRRKNSHAPYWSIPGGHLENGETFEACAKREVFEETGLKIENPKVITVTNNLKTWKEEGKHYVSVILFTEEFLGEVILKEPEKCEEWIWADPQNLPMPHFEASEDGISAAFDSAQASPFHHA